MPDGQSNYKAGQGRPPLHTQFKKGQSGNPGGRRDVAAEPAHVVRFPKG